MPSNGFAEPLSSTFHGGLLPLLSARAIIEDVNLLAGSGRAPHPLARRVATRSRASLAPLVASSAAGLAGLSLVALACGGATAGRVAQRRSADLAMSTTGPSAMGKYAASLAYSRCMRSHGVPGFPDPKQVAGGGIQVPGSQSGMSPDSPLLVSARDSCRHLLPGAGRPTEAGQQRELARMLHTSQCMRGHGISAFPDPSLSPPSNRAGYGAIMSNDGVWLAIPNSVDERSPLFDHAAAACNLGL